MSYRFWFVTICRLMCQSIVVYPMTKLKLVRLIDYICPVESKYSCPEVASFVIAGHETPT